MLKFLTGMFLGLSLATAVAKPLSYLPANVDGNGKLFGFIVQDNDGKEICRDPLVWVQFKGPDSFIVCDAE